MDEMIEKQVRQVMDGISGFSWLDQAYMAVEIAEMLKDFSHECLELEYGLTEE
jgi:hypothetical protein